MSILKRSLRSSLSMSLWSVPLVILLFSLQTPGEIRNDTLLARMDVEGSLGSLNIPIYAHLKGKSGDEYLLVFATLDELNRSLMPHTILDDPFRKGRKGEYLLVSRPEPFLKDEILKADGRDMPLVLHDDGKQMLLSATPEMALRLSKKGYGIRWLDRPLIETVMPVSLALQVMKDRGKTDERMRQYSDTITPLGAGSITRSLSETLSASFVESLPRDGMEGTFIYQPFSFLARYIRDTLNDSGFLTSDYIGIDQRKIVGVKKGERFPEERIVITHHFNPGKGRCKEAELKGCAQLLQLARALTYLPLEKSVHLTFYLGADNGAFNTESDADRAYRNGDHIVAVLGLETMPESEGTTLIVRDEAMKGYDVDLAIYELWRHTVDSAGLNRVLRDTVAGRYDEFSIQSPFWRRGYPGMLIRFGGGKTHLLRDSDSEHYQVAAARALLGTVIRLAEPSGRVKEAQADFHYLAHEDGIAFMDNSRFKKGRAISWEWDFGDGHFSENKNPTHRYAYEGEYFVSLMVNDGKGYRDGVVKRIQVRNAPEYCASRALSASYEWIENLSINGFDHSAQRKGYGDFTHKMITLRKGEPVHIRLLPGFKTDAVTEYFSVWIDLNRDGDFTDEGESLFEDAGINGVWGKVLFPERVTPGPKRMRVAMRYNRFANPCDFFTFGEVRDYTVFIEEKRTLFSFMIQKEIKAGSLFNFAGLKSIFSHLKKRLLPEVQLARH